MAGPQKVMQEPELQAAQNQQGTEGRICEKHHDCWGSILLGSIFWGAVRAWGLEQASTEGVRG